MVLNIDPQDLNSIYTPLDVHWKEIESSYTNAALCQIHKGKHGTFVICLNVPIFLPLGLGLHIPWVQNLRNHNLHTLITIAFPLLVLTKNYCQTSTYNQYKSQNLKSSKPVY